MSLLSKSLKVALIQIAAGANKQANLSKAADKIREAAKAGAKLIVLPECFNSPYSTAAFPEYAESIPDGESTKFLSDIAKETSVFLIGGSIPEKAGSKYYNTNVSFDTQGKIIAKHRKVHLFDIDVPGKIKFKESDILTGGDKATVFEIPGYGKVGLGICYDIRFPELAITAARQDAFAMIYPGAFNTTTGPLHWEILARARAVDNQIYVLVASPARAGDGYQAWGHSTVVDPWGKVISTTDEKESIVYATLEPEVLDSVSGIPVKTQRRFDVYHDISKEIKVSDV